MNERRNPTLMPLYRARENGRRQALEEMDLFRRREAQTRAEVPLREFERIEAETPMVERALHEGNLLPFLEFRESQARARWEVQVTQVKDRYTHAKLQADLKKAYDEEQARQHAQRIQQEILKHPDILRLLRQGRPIRQEGNRVIIGTHVLQAMLKAAELRRRFHDALIAAEAKPANTVRRPPTLQQRGFQRKAA